MHSGKSLLLTSRLMHRGMRSYGRRCVDICCRMITSCLSFFIIAEGVFGLRLSRLDIPGVVVRGDPAWLNCSYNLESDELYSIKWYKNNLEFYRYLPSDNPPGQKYDLLGIYLDLVKSELGHVYLYKTDLNSEGRYRCEVSADAPSFQTAGDHKEMRIYVLPEHGPVVSGAYDNYRIGDEVNITCKAAFSKPIAILKWYINGIEAPPNLENKYASLKHVTGLGSSRLGLKFIVEPKHFQNGTMKLRCASLLSQVYAKSSDEIVAFANQEKSGLHVGMDSEAVTITGGKARYQIGEHVLLNCTAIKSHPPAELRWYINDKKTRSDYIINYPPIRHADGKESSVLGLRFMVRPRDFKRNEMKLKCTATLSKVFNMSTKEMVLGTSQQSSGLHAVHSKGRALKRGLPSEVILWSIIAALLVTC